MRISLNGRAVRLGALVVAGLVAIYILQSCSGNANTATDEAQVDAGASAYSFVAEERGVPGGVISGPQYVLTRDDVQGFAVELAGFDVAKESRSEWLQRVGKLLVFSPQDFSEAVALEMVPNATQWESGEPYVKRVFTPLNAEAINRYSTGSVEQSTLWRVGGNLDLYGPDDSLLVSEYADIELTTQCYGPSIGECAVMSYEGVAGSLHLNDDADSLLTDNSAP